MDTLGLTISIKGRGPWQFNQGGRTFWPYEQHMEMRMTHARRGFQAKDPKTGRWRSCSPKVDARGKRDFSGSAWVIGEDRR